MYGESIAKTHCSGYALARLKGILFGGGSGYRELDSVKREKRHLGSCQRASRAALGRQSFVFDSVRSIVVERLVQAVKVK